MDVTRKFADITTEELEKVTTERLSLIQKISQFVERVTKTYGTVTKREGGLWHTNEIIKLHQFGGFNFVLDIEQTSMGGNDVEIWIDSQCVLRIHYQVSLDECSVRVFDETCDWQSRMKYVMDHEAEIVAQIKEEQQHQLEQKRLSEENADKRARLEEIAERLKLS